MSELARKPRDILKEQPVARRILTSVIARQEISSAYLFYGSKGLGRRCLAHWFVTALQCERPGAGGEPCEECQSCRQCDAGNHPDVHLLEPLGSRTTISIEQIREEVRPVLMRRTFSGRHKAVLVPQAQRLTPEAQNAMLKTLEEPSGSSVMVLISTSLEPLLPTVRSRCVRVPFQNLNFSLFKQRLKREHSVPEDRYQALYLATAGDVALARDILDSDEALDRWKGIGQLAGALVRRGLSPVQVTDWANRLGESREEAREYLALLTVALRRELLGQKEPAFASFAGCTDVISVTEEALTANANVRLALEVMLVKLRRNLHSDYN